MKIYVQGKMNMKFHYFVNECKHINQIANSLKKKKKKENKHSVCVCDIYVKYRYNNPITKIFILSGCVNEIEYIIFTV